MNTNNSIGHSIHIHAMPAKIWDELTNPDKIMQYTGSRTETDWAVGSAITWKGEMNGTAYCNKGKVLEHIPEKLLRYTYWSGMGGDPDVPENYSEITYTLYSGNDGSMELSYSRTHIPTDLEKQVFEQHLPYMLDQIRQLAET